MFAAIRHTSDAKERCRYVGYALTTQWEGQEAAKLQMIGFDMGGTSTDVSRFAGSYEHVLESTTAGTGYIADCKLSHVQASTASQSNADEQGTVTSFDSAQANDDAGVTIQAPQLDINTVAAGGGSRLFFRTGVFQVSLDVAGQDLDPSITVSAMARQTSRKRQPLTLLAPSQARCEDGSLGGRCAGRA